MGGLRYLSNVATLKLDANKCIGCNLCMEVCPHAVFSMDNKSVKIQDHDACMECGACAMNCPVEAITVRSGVGCAAYIINTGPFRNTDPDGGCSGSSCGG